MDEFLQQKFAQDNPEERLVFREEYWLQAQALIEADERRRKRRFFWWWLTGAGLLLLLLAGWWFFAAQPAPTGSFAQTNRSAPAPASGHPTGAGLAPVSAQGGGPDSADPVSSVSTPALSAGQTQGATPIAASPAARSSVLAPETGHSSARPIPTGPGRKTAPTGTAPSAAAIGPAGTVARGTAGSGNAAPTPSGTAVPPAGSRQAEAPGETLPKGGVLPISTPGPVLVDTLGSQPLDAPASFRRRASLERLPMLLRFLTRPLPKIRALAVPPLPPVARIQPQRDWRWDAGVLVAAATPSGQLEQEGPGIGVGLSARVQRKSSPWSVNLDLLLRRQSGSLPDGIIPKGEENLRYSFGYIREYAQQQVSGLYRLELPLAAQYRWRALRAEAGAIPSVLLSVWAREERVRETSLEPTPRVLDTRQVQINNRYFSTFNMSCFAGVEWQAGRRLVMGLRAHYQPGLFQRETDLDLPQPHAFWGDLRLRYFFFSTKK
ncbi:MAG: hypothetical protein IT260_07635 [Saprospiraceae bacterium]|nr:hypothetical protein [Saprospiraceae bacterium]